MEGKNKRKTSGREEPSGENGSEKDLRGLFQALGFNRRCPYETLGGETEAGTPAENPPG